MDRQRHRSTSHRDTMFRYPQWVSIPHYYGDTMRMYFIGGTALMLLAAPFYTGNIRLEMPFILAGAVCMVVLAALTGPHNRTIMTLNVVGAAVLTIMFGGWALLSYGDISSLAFVLRDAIALVFLIALYFSLKTLRAMYMDQIGREPSLEEFRDETVAETDFVAEAEMAVQDEEGENPAMSEPEDEALDGLGNPAAPEVDKGGD